MVIEVRSPVAGKVDTCPGLFQKRMIEPGMTIAAVWPHSYERISLVAKSHGRVKYLVGRGDYIEKGGLIAIIRPPRPWDFLPWRKKQVREEELPPFTRPEPQKGLY